MMYLLADAAPLAQQGSSFEMTLVMLVTVMGFMYFLVYRPESKRRKSLEAKRSSMKKGDRLIIAGGIVAEFVRPAGTNVIVKLHDGAKMEILPIAIQDVEPNAQAQASEQTKSDAE
jgi:preprotein translocase subunit YajC